MVEEKTQIETVAVAKTDNTPKALTAAEKQWRLAFIGTCVDRNVMLDIPAKFGVIRPLTIQDIINSSPNTLIATIKSIRKAITDYDPDLEASEELKIRSIAAKDWEEMLTLQLRMQRYKLHVSELRAKKKELEGVLAELKTPEERRREAQEGLASLAGLADED